MNIGPEELHSLAMVASSYVHVRNPPISSVRSQRFDRNAQHLRGLAQREAVVRFLPHDLRLAPLHISERRPAQREVHAPFRPKRRETVTLHKPLPHTQDFMRRAKVVRLRKRLGHEG
jgi:hypothetical protein